MTIDRKQLAKRHTDLRRLANRSPKRDSDWHDFSMELNDIAFDIDNMLREPWTQNR